MPGLHLFGVRPFMGEMYVLSNATESVIDVDGAWHVLSLAGITAGALDGWTYADGVRGTDITAYATNDAGASTLVTTTADHNLAEGDFISITNAAHHNDLYEILSVPTAKTFVIDKSWVAGDDDGQGTYARGGTLTAGAEAEGHYSAAWNVSISPAAPQNIFTMGFMIGKTACSKCRARQKLAVAGDYNTMAGNAILDISAGAKVSFIIKNVGATGNYTIRHGNVNFHKP